MRLDVGHGPVLIPHLLPHERLCRHEAWKLAFRQNARVPVRDQEGTAVLVGMV